MEIGEAEFGVGVAIVEGIGWWVGAVEHSAACQCRFGCARSSDAFPIEYVQEEFRGILTVSCNR